MNADRPALMTPAPRLRSMLLLAAGLGAGVLLSALAPRQAPAQSAIGDSSSIFRAGTEVDPRDARFRRPPPGQRPDGRSRFGEIPAFGNPPASGAGAMGFDSTNTLRRAGRAVARRSVTAGPVPLVPVRAAPDPGRRGASADPGAAGAPPVPQIATPTRRRPAAVPDPFDPVGLRVGAMTLWPAIELTGGYETNPPRTALSRGSSLLVVAPELRLRSDWERHALTAEIKGNYTAYSETFGCCNADGTMTGTPNSLSRPSLDSKVNGRLDVTSHDRIEMEGRLQVGTDNPGSPNITAGLERLPIYTMFGGTLGYVHSFNRFEISARAGADRRVYQWSTFTDGTTESNDDRNYNQFAGTLRGSYDLLPGVKPFAEVGVDTRLHDFVPDRTNADRNSVGQTMRAGTTFEFSRKLTGEISAGYISRSYQDPTLSGIGGFAFDSTLIWTASPLTTLTLSAKSTVDEIIVTGVSGVLRRDLAIQADHAFRRWLIGTVKFGYGLDDYVGMAREDQRFLTSLGLTYKLNREVWIKGEYRREWLTSTVSSVNYTADVFMLGVRLQR